jgi:coproporphyrinogen III oxidase
MPPLATWEYNHLPETNSSEMQTQALLRKGIDWTGN